MLEKISSLIIIHEERDHGSLGGQRVLPVSLRKTAHVKVSQMDTDIEHFTPSQLSGKINLEERMDEGTFCMIDIMGC